MSKRLLKPKQLDFWPDRTSPAMVHLSSLSFVASSGVGRCVEGPAQVTALLGPAQGLQSRAATPPLSNTGINKVEA